MSLLLFLIICITLQFSTLVFSKTCNIMDYGGKGDGKANDTNAIIAAINDCGKARSTSDPSILLFPADHKFSTSPFGIDASKSELKSWAIPNSQIILASNTSIINGITKASNWPSGVKQFIQLSHLQSFSIIGANKGAYKLDENFVNSSIIDGSGTDYYSKKAGPHLIIISHTVNITIKALTLQNSPRFHLDLSGSGNSVMFVSDMTIMAPADSPNTDAMDISGSNAYISNCYLATGDDNIAIKPNAYNMTISNVYCGHGHGTSIGSIGEDESTGYAENIYFENIIYKSTTNVARVKTWQGGKGTVSNITYKNIQFSNVQYPILINQYYCPSSQHPDPCKNSSIAVEVKDIRFENFYGTQTKGYCGKFECSDSVHCNDIILKNVTCQPAQSDGKNDWSCWEVDDGTATDVKPPIKTQGNCHW